MWIWMWMCECSRYEVHTISTHGDEYEIDNVQVERLPYDDTTTQHVNILFIAVAVVAAVALSNECAF